MKGTRTIGRRMRKDPTMEIGTTKIKETTIKTSNNKRNHKIIMIVKSTNQSKSAT